MGKLVQGRAVVFDYPGNAVNVKLALVEQYAAAIDG